MAPADAYIARRRCLKAGGRFIAGRAFTGVSSGVRLARVWWLWIVLRSKLSMSGERAAQRKAVGPQWRRMRIVSWLQSSTTTTTILDRTRRNPSAVTGPLQYRPLRAVWGHGSRRCIHRSSQVLKSWRSVHSGSCVHGSLLRRPSSSSLVAVDCSPLQAVDEWCTSCPKESGWTSVAEDACCFLASTLCAFLFNSVMKTIIRRPAEDTGYC
ncbi:hypothetical protein C8R46DRAFT_180389 [Mycena filopes]|nr:hypothetical protein C8R46DRAFT_180389 [Mycena filopes]